MTVVVGRGALSRADLVAVARRRERVELDAEALAGLVASRAAIDALVASGQPVYGLSTGFGALASTFISPERRADLQRSLIRSHAAGVGDDVETEVVRAMMASAPLDPVHRGDRGAPARSRPPTRRCSTPR